MSRLLRVSGGVTALLLSWQFVTTKVSAQQVPPAEPKPAAQPAPTQPAPTQPAPTQPAPAQPPAEGAAPAVEPDGSSETTPTESAEVAAEAEAAPAPAETPVPNSDEDPNEASRALMEPRIIDTSGMDDEEEEEPSEPEVNPNTLPFTYHMRHIDLAAGVRVLGATHDGLQPFLVDPVIGEVYVRGGYAFPIADRFALAGLLEGSVKELHAEARDIPTDLTLGYLSLGLEGRFHAHHRLYFYARVAPGIETGRAAYGEEEGEGVYLTDWKSTFQLDGTGGLAVRFAGTSDGRKRGVRFWGFFEGGYRYTGKHKFELEAENGPERVQPIALDPLTTRGGFFSTGVMLTF